MLILFFDSLYLQEDFVKVTGGTFIYIQMTQKKRFISMLRDWCSWKWKEFLLTPTVKEISKRNGEVLIALFSILVRRSSQMSSRLLRNSPNKRTKRQQRKIQRLKYNSPLQILTKANPSKPSKPGDKRQSLPTARKLSIISADSTIHIWTTLPKRYRKGWGKTNLSN